MQMKKITMLLAAGCAIGMLTGCGIPEEEHNMIIAELEQKHAAEVDALNGTIGEKDDVIKAEKAKVRQNRIELDDASTRIKDLQEKTKLAEKSLATEKSKVSGLESDLKTSKSMTAAASDRAMEAENSYSTLDVEYQELKRRFEMFQKNLNAISEPPSSAAMDEEPAPLMDEAPKSNSKSASSLLDEMSMF